MKKFSQFQCGLLWQGRRLRPVVWWAGLVIWFTVIVPGYALNFTNLQVLWSFPATNATVDPFAAVTEGSDGMLYGTTYGSGVGTNLGVVFKISRNGNNFSVMHRFTANEGDTPSAP